MNQSLWFYYVALTKHEETEIMKYGTVLLLTESPTEVEHQHLDGVTSQDLPE